MARILIAEHNESTSSYLFNTLKKAGNSVEVVDNCLDAWRVSSRETFDVLLVNVVMPGIDGFVLAQKALQDPIEKMVAFEYEVTGTWQDPVVTRKRRPVQDPGPAGRR